jgi:GTPase SAR1 family protein
MDDVIIELGLWDTSGAEEYDRLRPLSYANANVILLVFSVVQPSTLEHISSKVRIFIYISLSSLCCR